MPTRAFKVTREPEHKGFSGPREDFLILVDGKPIGGTYYCSRSDIPRGKKWASWGPGGLSMGHKTREDAEQAKVDEYKTDPAGYDRKLAAETGRRARA